MTFSAGNKKVNQIEQQQQQSRATIAHQHIKSNLQRTLLRRRSRASVGRRVDVGAVAAVAVAYVTTGSYTAPKQHKQPKNSSNSWRDAALSGLLHEALRGHQACSQGAAQGEPTPTPTSTPAPATPEATPAAPPTAEQRGQLNAYAAGAVERQQQQQQQDPPQQQQQQLAAAVVLAGRVLCPLRENATGLRCL